MKQVDLEAYDNHPYNPGGNVFKRVLWHYISAVFFKTSLLPFYAPKNFLLRLFGAKIGKQVEVKPCVNIKYPWWLTIGDEVWIGENVWIDCLLPVSIGNNICISQGAILLTGNHNYKKRSFDLIVKGFTIEDGAWICAFAIVSAGVTVGSHAVLTSGSVATKNLEPYSIYQGNPAEKIRERVIE